MVELDMFTNDMQNKNRFLQDLAGQYGQSAQPNSMDYVNSYLQTITDNMLPPQRNAPTYQDRVNSNVESRIAPMKAQYSAQTDVYGLMEKAANEGDVAAKRVIDNAKLLAGDDPNDLGAVLTKMQEYEQNGEANFEQDNPVPFLTRAIKETGVKPRSYKMESIGVRADSNEIKKEDLGIKRDRVEQTDTSLDLRAKELEAQKTKDAVTMKEKAIKNEAAQQDLDAQIASGLTPEAYAAKQKQAGKNIAANDVTDLAIDNTTVLLSDLKDVWKKSDVTGKFSVGTDKGGTAIGGANEFIGKALGTNEQVQRSLIEKGINNLQLLKSQASLKGQGQVTEFERKLLATTLPTMDVPAAIAIPIIDDLIKAAERQKVISGKIKESGQMPNPLNVIESAPVDADGVPDLTDIINSKKKSKDSLSFIMNDLEGGGKTVNDINNAPVKYGVNQAYSGGKDVSKLSENDARKFYEQNYNLSGLGIDNTSEAFKLVAQDAIIQHGKDPQTQSMINASGGNPMKLLQLRAQYIQQLAQKDPQKYMPIMNGLMNRYSKLAKQVQSMGNA